MVHGLCGWHCDSDLELEKSGHLVVVKRGPKACVFFFPWFTGLLSGEGGEGQKKTSVYMKNYICLLYIYISVYMCIVFCYRIPQKGL